MVLNAARSLILRLLSQGGEASNAVLRCIRVFEEGPDQTVSVGFADREDIIEKYRIRLEHLSNLGVEMIGAVDLLARLSDLASDEVALVAARDGEFEFTLFLDPDLRSLIACIGVPKRIAEEGQLG